MDKKNILKQIRSKGITPIELEAERYDSVKILKSNSLDELLDIVMHRESKNIFMGLSNYHERDFLIRCNPARLSTKGIEKVNIYNAYINSMDFSRPYKATIFTVIDSILVGVNFNDDWIRNEDIADPEALLETIEEEDEDDLHNEQLERLKINNESNKEEKDRLMKIILDDPEFPSNKNQETRYWYFINLIEKEDMKEFRDILKPYGSLRFGNVKIFMDETWRKYKEIAKEK